MNASAISGLDLTAALRPDAVLDTEPPNGSTGSFAADQTAAGEFGHSASASQTDRRETFLRRTRTAPKTPSVYSRKPDAAAQPDGSTGAAGQLPFVQLFSDGACSGNPGPGGWAYILRHPASGATVENSGGEADTTNNQMELQAVIAGLTALKRRSQVEIVTDSEYVAKGCQQWLAGWKRNGWRRREGKQLKPVKNVERWQLLDELLARHLIRFTVVRGHSGHAENERCDELAVAAAHAVARR